MEPSTEYGHTPILNTTVDTFHLASSPKKCNDPNQFGHGRDNVNFYDKTRQIRLVRKAFFETNITTLDEKRAAFRSPHRHVSRILAMQSQIWRS